MPSIVTQAAFCERRRKMTNCTQRRSDGRVTFYKRRSEVFAQSTSDQRHILAFYRFVVMPSYFDKSRFRNNFYGRVAVGYF